MKIETKYDLGDKVEFETPLGEGTGIITAISTLHDEIGYEDAISYLINAEECINVDMKYVKAYEREIVKKVEE